MINLDLYPKFKADIQTRNLNIYALVILGWDKDDKTLTPFGSPTDDAIFISERKENIDNYYFKDCDLKIPSITENQDFLDSKYKINNVSVTLSNYLTNGSRFSDDLENKSLVNKQAVILWKSQSCVTLSDCFPVYIGLIKKLKHTDKSANISIEDFTESYLKKEVPIEKMPNESYVNSENKAKPIPMIYGDIDAVPVPFSMGEPVAIQGDEFTSTGVSKLKLYLDSKGLVPDAIQSYNMQVGNTTINRDPVYVLDNESYFSVVKNSLSDSFFPTNYFVEDLANNPNINFYVPTSETEGALDNEFSDDEDLEEVLEPNQIVNDTYRDTIRIQVFQKPNNVDMWYEGQNHRPEYLPTPEKKSYPNEQAYYDDNPDHDYKVERATEEGAGGLNTESFIEFIGTLAPRSRLNWKGANFQILCAFEDSGIPFSSDLLLNVDEGLSPTEQNPTKPYVLIKAKICTSTKIEYTIRHYDGSEDSTGFDDDNYHYFDWDNNEGVRFSDYNSDSSGTGIGSATNYYADDAKIGDTWLANEPIITWWDLNDNQFSQQDNHQKSKGRGIGFRGEVENTDIDGLNEGSSLESTSFPNGRWVNTTLDNITTDGNATHNIDDFNIPSDTMSELYIGAGRLPKTEHIKYKSSDENQWWSYHHNYRIRLYNIRQLNQIVVKDLANKDYYVRVNKGRADIDGSHEYGYTWIIKHLLLNELELPESTIDNDSYNKSKGLEGLLNTQYLGFAQNEDISAKELIQDICKSTQFSTKFKNDGTFSFNYLQNRYMPSDVDITIKSDDVINYQFSQTSFGKIYSKVSIDYHKDYGNDKHNAYYEDVVTNYNLDNGVNSYDLNYYGLSNVSAYTGEETHKSSTLEIQSDYIRSKTLWENKITGTSNDMTGKDDGYINEYAKYLLLNNCQQKLIIQVTLPLSYLSLETGDVIKFDKLIGNLKAYGNDYTKLQAINGMWCYPAFICTSVSKSSKDIKAKFMQLWYIGDDNNHQWYEEGDVNVVFGCTDPNAVNYNPLANHTNDTICWYKGDANHDGIVNVIDVITLVNNIFAGNTQVTEQSSNQLKALDMNNDGVLDIVDIVALVNTILSDAEEEVAGCMLEDALNYNPYATLNSGCIMPSYVCDNPTAINYFPTYSSTNITDEQVEQGIVQVEGTPNSEVCLFHTNFANFLTPAQESDGWGYWEQWESYAQETYALSWNATNENEESYTYPARYLYYWFNNNSVDICDSDTLRGDHSITTHNPTSNDINLSTWFSDMEINGFSIEDAYRIFFTRSTLRQPVGIKWVWSYQDSNEDNYFNNDTGGSGFPRWRNEYNIANLITDGSQENFNTKWDNDGTYTEFGFYKNYHETTSTGQLSPYITNYNSKLITMQQQVGSAFPMFLKSIGTNGNWIKPCVVYQIPLDAGYYQFLITDITFSEVNEGIQITIFDNAEQINDQDYDKLFNGVMPTGAVNDVNTNVIPLQSNNSSLISDSRYNNNEIYDDWGNSIASTNTIPAQKFAITERKLITIYITYHYDTDTDNTMQFRSPRIYELTEEEYNG